MDTRTFAVGDSVWVHSHRAWRRATVTGLGVTRVKATVVTNARTGRTVQKWFGGRNDGGFPVYPGHLPEPETYHCLIGDCPLSGVAWDGHPGVTEAQLKVEHDRAWHSARTKETSR